MAIDNYFIADQFSLLSKLLDIHGDTSFKSRTYGAAAFNIEKLPEQLTTQSPEQIQSIKGIGASVSGKILEIIENGKLSALDELIGQTPSGVIEMLSIKGLGPKKISAIWKEMQIESIGELLYACNENRLGMFKGFGGKTQQNIQEAIEFYLQNQGSFLYSEIAAIYPAVLSYLQKSFGSENVHVTGAYRRQQLTIDETEFVVAKSNDEVKKAFATAFPPELLEETTETLVYKLKNGLRLKLYTGADNITKRLFITTGSEEFVEAYLTSYPATDFSMTEKDIFKQAGIEFIDPYLRESADLSSLSRITNETLIQESDIKGIIHSHSNWSDGLHTIEEMARACIERKFEYLVISDHSKAAAYAGGLSEEKIHQQHIYIDELNQQFAPFKIFKSIECDILGDGSLDYSNSILSTFDLVIASIHSNLKMTEEKAMMRILKAIENPYTTILGHPTGRLLLSRSGYPLDHMKMIDACAANHVVIELNAHPRRLDMDWRWIQYALNKGVMISIDPDAHTIEGYNDCRYGVFAAQKGGLTAKHNLSSFGLNELEGYLRERKL
ncbi:MAG: DNA polymerase/3'-5' exonuclease PolX [Chitinophagaceae bacterium]|nr:DNA polymerase/3'-5' exonuclease PolX [Chitinophagaceae bacterium]